MRDLPYNLGLCLRSKGRVRFFPNFDRRTRDDHLQGALLLPEPELGPDRCPGSGVWRVVRSLRVSELLFVHLRTGFHCWESWLVKSLVPDLMERRVPLPWSLWLFPELVSLWDVR